MFMVKTPLNMKEEETLAEKFQGLNVSWQLGWGPGVVVQEEGKVTTFGRAECTTKIITFNDASSQMFVHASEKVETVMVGLPHVLK